MNKQNRIDEWKKIILTLPDADFFDLMRTYMGKLKTPFNKQRLIENLVNFLLRDDNLAKIRDYIDEDDAVLLTLISMMKDPAVSDVIDFFKEGKTYIELHNQILNLEERLLIYIENISGRRKIRLSPIFYEIAEDITSPALLFPFEDVEQSAAPMPWLMDPLLLAFFSFLLKKPDMLKSNGEFKKKSLDDIVALFPQLIELAPEGLRLNVLQDVLLNTKLAILEEGCFHLNLARWKELGGFDPDLRHAYLWASSLSGKEREIMEYADLISSFILVVPKGKAFTREALVKLLFLCSIGRYSYSLADLNRVFEKLESLGVIASPGTGLFMINPHLSAHQRGDAEGHDEQGIIIQPNFDITIKPWVTLNEGLIVAMVAEIIGFDLYPRYELNKLSFFRGCDLGLNGSVVIHSIQELSGGFVPQNIHVTLENWAKEYQGVQIFKGYVLTADDIRRHYIEHSDEIKPYIKKVLAPGVYLLNYQDIDTIQDKLKKAGLEAVPEIKDYTRSEGSAEISAAPWKITVSSIDISWDLRKDLHFEPEKIKAAKQEMRGKLNDLSIPASQKEELCARIDRKLIIQEQQIQPGVVRQEKNEAKGIDYLGKVRLVERAIKSKSSYLEINEPIGDGEVRRILVVPEDIEKKGKDVMLHGKILPDHEEVTINVSKISLLRKIRSSMFNR